MSRTNGAPPREGDKRFDDNASGDRASFNENPEVAERAAEGNDLAPENDYELARDNGEPRENGDQERSRGGSPARQAENGRAEEQKSPRYSSAERRSERFSQSPYNNRRDSNAEHGDAEERAGRGRRRGSRSGSPIGSPRAVRHSRSPRGGRADSRDRDGRRDRGSGETCSVYVTGFSRSARREDLHNFFARVGGEIRDVHVKSKFAFVEYKRPEDAAEAVRQLDRAEFDGYKLTVQLSHPDGSKRRRRTTGPQSNDECWKCGKLGHWANDCRESKYGGRRDDRRRSNSRDRRSRSPPRYNRNRRSRSRSGEGRSRELREGRCFLCQQKGHIKRDCPENRGGGRPMGRRGGRYEDRDRGYHRRSPSRSRSPRGDYRRNDMGGRMDPPPRRHYSRSRSPQPDRRYGGDRGQSRD